MGRLIIDSKSIELVEYDYYITKETRLLYEEACKLANETDDNVFIAVDISNKHFKDLSTMIVSKVEGENINILYCKNELDFNKKTIK